jgi:hypothetical protein
VSPHPFAVAAALAVLATGCAGNAPAPTTAPTRTLAPTDPPCPKPKPTKPNWPKEIPDFIPRPEGVTIQKVTPASDGNVTQVRFSTPKSMTESRDFVLSEFKKNGLHLGRGDAEPSELDVQFQRNEGLRGLVRIFATTERCTTLWLLAVVRDTSAPYDIGYTPAPSSSPLPFG